MKNRRLLIYTSWPLPLTTSGASKLLAGGLITAFFPKWNSDLARRTSSTELRRMGTVPRGQCPAWCHACHALRDAVLPALWFLAAATAAFGLFAAL